MHVKKMQDGKTGTGICLRACIAPDRSFSPL
jgi:hypothetical protein